jgi:hypothetical protein
MAISVPGRRLKKVLWNEQLQEQKEGNDRFLGKRFHLK